MQTVYKIFIAGLLGITTFFANAECKKNVFLTFDSGNMKDAEFIADTLRKEAIKATFFIANNPTIRNNRVLDPDWKEYWVKLIADGHVFGNHTLSHHYQRRDRNDLIEAVTRKGKRISLDKMSFCEELQSVERQFHQLTGAELSDIWRAPAGRTTQNSIRYAAQCGYPIHVGWTNHGYIGDDLSSDKYSNEKLLKRTLDHVQDNEILILHLGVWDRKISFAPMIPKLIKDLKEKGFCFRQIKE